MGQAVVAARCFLAAVLVSLALSFLGGLALCHIEGPAEEAALLRRASMQQRLEAELTPETYRDLVGAGWWEHLELATPEAPADAAGDPQEPKEGERPALVIGGRRQWGGLTHLSFAGAFLTTFTFSSTIGYGSAPLRTETGKVFACIFSLVAIPFTVAVYTFVAVKATKVIKLLIVSVQYPSWDAFCRYDADESGTLEETEFCGALRDLGLRHVDEKVAVGIMKRVEPRTKGKHLHFAEFCHALHLLLPPTVQLRHRRARTIAVFMLVLLWLLIGGALFSWLEGWSFADALWFSWITLTTIGLGDFVPSTWTGEVVAVIWSTAGLGFLAMLMTTLGERLARVASLDQDEDDEADEPTDHEKCQLRVFRLIHRSNSNFLMPALSQETVPESDRRRSWMPAHRGSLASAPTARSPRPPVCAQLPDDATSGRDGSGGTEEVDLSSCA